MLSEGGVISLGVRKNKANEIVHSSESGNLKDIMSCLRYGDREFGPANLSYDELRAVDEIKLALQQKLHKHK